MLRNSPSHFWMIGAFFNHFYEVEEAMVPLAYPVTISRIDPEGIC